jgi:D-alanine-D-alanine ligase
MNMNRYHKVGVLMGGPSSEREVSLRSGAAIARGLRQAGYDVTEVDVKSALLTLPPGLEAVFVALHGEFGEDGQIQELLRSKKIPYTGSGPESSRAAFDKLLSKQIFNNHDIPTPAYEILRKGDVRKLPLPVVVKPIRQGSSLGVFCVFEEKDWADALAKALVYDGEVLVESYISGHELTISIVGDDVLPVVEIKAPGGFYDYRAKYTKGLTEYIVPAQIPADRAEACQKLAWKTFKALNCEGMGRVDIRMQEDGALYVLELNNIPGFTETSLMPKAAQAAGLSFSELCDRILKMASVH